MAVRPEMAYIITFVRDLINDPAGSDQQFTDQQIQDRLDMTRRDIYRECMVSRDTLLPNGTIEWHDFFTTLSFWEPGYVIQKGNGEVVTPDEDELLVGRFYFEDHMSQPLYITGKVYNVYRVAAQLITSWISVIRGQISSWTADGTTIQRAGQIRDMRNLASEYAGYAWNWGHSAQVKLRRNDMRGSTRGRFLG